MKVNKNHVVTLQYSLSVPTETGEEIHIETTSPEQPLVFLFGVGQLLPDFENNLLDKAIGDAFDFIIKSENAYGPHEAERIIEIPVDVFFNEQGVIDPSLQVGKRIPMSDNQGNRLWGLILHMGLENVRMDFNHALAGKDLHFVGQITDLRAASSEELEHGHVHGPGGHQH